MANEWVGFGSGQSGYELKRVILSWLKTDSVGSGWVYPKFSHELLLLLLYIKKTTYICHLENYVTNYLM